MNENLIPASDFQAEWPVRDANARRFSSSKHSDECFLCGRGLTERAVENGWWIEMTTDGMLIKAGTDTTGLDSQGCFPVGSECAKRLPAGFKTKA